MPNGVARPHNAAPPRGVLEALAPMARSTGNCLLLLSSDGTVSFHDPAAGLFFERYIVPALRHEELAAQELRARLQQLTAQSPAQLWDIVPGVLLAVVPVVQRRQIQGVLVLAARRHDFQLNKPLRQVCQLMGLDPIWLQHQASQLMAQDPQQLLASLGLFLSMLSDRTRLAVLEEEINSLSSQLANTYEELTLIERISGGLRVNRSNADFFRQTCLDLMQVVCVRGMGVVLHSERCQQEPVLYGELSLPPGQVCRLAVQLLATLRQRQSSLLINDLASHRDYQWLAQFAHQLIAVPLQRGEQVLGCLFGLDKLSGNGVFDSVDAKLLTSIATESAVYLENAMLFGDVHDLMMGLLHSLTSAVDAKDAYTCGHSERVAMLSRHLAQKAGLPDPQIEHVYMAGLLHDVGKIGVPESVLQKTGRLTPEEYEEMKKHPLIGARILNDVKQLGDVIPGVLHHHERFDGSGYPAGLAGANIPLAGRIICLADCFDAMTSNRTYRKALPLEVALTEIRRCSGTQFDPALAEVFLQITPEQFRTLLRDHQMQAKRLVDLQETLRAA